MKKEKLSFLILFVEIAAIVFLHSAKNNQADGGDMLTAQKAVVGSPYQLKAVSFTKRWDLLSNVNYATVPKRNQVLIIAK